MKWKNKGKSFVLRGQPVAGAGENFSEWHLASGTVLRDNVKVCGGGEVRQKWECLQQRLRNWEQKFHQRRPRRLGDSRRLWARIPLLWLWEWRDMPWIGGPLQQPQLRAWRFLLSSLPAPRLLDVSSQESWKAGILNSGRPVPLKRPCTSGSPCRERMGLPAFSLKCLFAATQTPTTVSLPRRASPRLSFRAWCRYPFCSLCTHQNKQTETQTHPSRLIVRELAPMLAQPDEFR